MSDVFRDKLCKQPFEHFSWWLCYCAHWLAMAWASPIDKPKLDLALPPGEYGGCSQKMLIGRDGAVSYGDNLGLTRIRIEPDGQPRRCLSHGGGIKWGSGFHSSAVGLGIYAVGVDRQR